MSRDLWGLLASVRVRRFCARGQAWRSSTRVRRRRWGVTLIAVGVLVGCGLYGGTKSFVLEAPEPLPSRFHHRVQGGTVTVGARANRVYAVGVNPMGGFRSGDRQVLEKSLRNTLKAIDWPDDRPAWTTHAQIRAYVAAYNNSSGALLASVAWCLMSTSGDVVYDEQFYASTTEGITLGAAKDILNKAIARRIQKSAVFLSASQSPRGKLPIAGDYLYESIDDAARDLPASLFSSQIGSVGDNPIDWTSFDPKDPIDWARVVALR